MCSRPAGDPSLIHVDEQEFYIPLESNSLHFLKSRICIGCTKGFEIVDLETLDTQGLLDPQDSTLDFVKRREGMVRPMAIYRVDTDFLLCYDGECHLGLDLHRAHFTQSLHST